MCNATSHERECPGDGVHPRYAPRRPHRGQLRMRRLSRPVRRRCTRHVLPLQRRRIHRRHQGRRRHLGMHEHSGPLRPGQHLPRRFHGRMEQPFRTIPRPRMDAARCVRELPRIQILPRQRDASARRNGTTARVPLQETVMTYGI